ncbi:hypothetical protein HG531_007665 [Fusarium graminearum]|nr:hypothetical protein HG531_007665 [Fusarium graminearum]
MDEVKLLCLLVFLGADSVEAGRAKDDSSKSEIRDHPKKDNTGADTSIVIHLSFLKLTRGWGGFDLDEFLRKDCDFSLILRIQVSLIGEPSKDHVDCVEDELDEEGEFSEERVVRSKEVEEVNNGVYSSEERTVQPTTSLEDQLRHLTIALGYELKAKNTIFSEEVLLKGTLSVLIVLKGNVARLIKNVAHLVLKILSSDQWVQKVPSTSTQHSLDLTTGTTAHGLQIERLPEMVNGASARSCTSIEKNTNVGVQDSAESVKEPSVRVDLLSVLLLQAEEHLDRLASVNKLYNIVLDLEMGLRGVLVNMGCDGLVVDVLLGNAFLINTHTSQKSPSSGVNLGSTITDNTNNNLFPGVFAPCLAVWSVTHVLDVLEYTRHGSGKQNLVLVVHCYDNEQLGVPRLAEEPLSQRKIVVVKIVWVARSS